MTRSGVLALDGAIAVPPPSRADAHLTGVLHNGQPVEPARTFRGQDPAHGDPRACPPAARLDGSWMWAGQLYWHFGHFLTESATRLWAFEALRERLDGIVFTPKRYGAGHHLLAWQAEFLALAGIRTDVRVVTAPTEIETLLVPRQEFGAGRLIGGGDNFRRFIAERFATDIRPDGPERLYLSRSRFGPRKGGILGEDMLEHHLAAEGYEVFHPELHPLHEQIARIKAARRLVGPDGSAFHLAGLVARPDLRAAMILRRNTETARPILHQFSALLGARLHAINAIRQDWTPNGAPPDRLSFAELDFADLSRALRRHGLIDGEGWADPDRPVIARQLRRLGRRRGVRLRPVAAEPRVAF